MVIPNERFLKTILDLYSDKTGIPIAFVYNNEIIWQTSKELCSPYCKHLNDLWPDKCLENHIERSKKEELTMCHAGLWNYIVPIIKDKEHKGALLTGQRRISSKEQESLECLLCLKNKISEDEFLILRDNYYKTPIIKEFEVDLIKMLELVQEHLYDLFINWDNEKRKILNLAHEFLLPIQSIIANAENIYSELGNDRGVLKSEAEDLMQQVIKLAMTAENMRSSMMGTKHDEKYIYELRNVRDILNENILIFKNEALWKNVGINDPTIIGGISPVIPVSYNHLKRAFFNLIHNAVKYSYFSISASHRYIDIKIRTTNNLIIIELSNYGIGILQDEIRTGKIFQDGYRGILSSDSERTGSGIGLSESKRIIEKHGGTLNIESNLLGDNEYSGPYLTTVTISLPRYR